VKWVAGTVFSAVLVLALGAIALGFARILFPWQGMFVFGEQPDPVFGLSRRAPDWSAMFFRICSWP